MTKEQLPPTYDSSSQPAVDRLEKSENSQCPHDGKETKHIDAALDNIPNARDQIRSIGDALIRVADQDQCTKCATEDAVLNLTSLLKSVKTIKKSKGWSKEEKKALKKEAKALSKGLKAEAKEIWKSSRSSVSKDCDEEKVIE